MPSSTQNSLQFNNVSDITFQVSSSAISIYVSGNLLGTINQTYPVTVYITNVNGVKTIWIKEITDAEYNQGNTSDTNADTMVLNYNTRGVNLHVEVCGSNNSRYKFIGWDDETVGETCTGSGGYYEYYDISSNMNFKTKIEQIMISGSMQMRMVTRYATNVNNRYSGSNPVCVNGLYCYMCIG